MNNFIQTQTAITTFAQEHAPQEPQRKLSKTLAEAARDLLAKVTPADWQELAERHLGNSLMNSEGKARKPRQKEAIVLICEEFKTALTEQGGGISKLDGKLHLYLGNHWQPIEPEETQRFIGLFAEKLGNDPTDSKFYQFRESLEKQLMQACRPVKRDPQNILINFRNGTLTIGDKAHEMQPHDMNHGLTYCLGFDYTPQSQAPSFQQYLDRVLPDKECQTVLAEFLGLVFLRDLKLEKMLVLYGGGHNGKSVLFDIINALLGEENVSSIGLNSLNKIESRTPLIGKLLNYGSEISGNVSPDTLKQMASGEKMEFRRLYGDNFTSDNYARLAFNANSLPSETEMTTGYFRRFLIVPFEQVITEDEKDPDLASKIIKTELAGVMNWILEGAERLRVNRKFSPCEKSDQQLAKYQKESDNVAMFIEEERYISDYDAQGILKRDLYNAYRSFCQSCGYRPLKISNFNKRLEDQHSMICESINRGNVWRISCKQAD